MRLFFRVQSLQRTRPGCTLRRRAARRPWESGHRSEVVVRRAAQSAGPDVDDIVMRTTQVQGHTEAVEAVVRAVAHLDSAEFSAYPGGWPKEIGTALVDAVFSIRARYASAVLPRLQVLRQEHPEIRNDLRALSALDEQELLRVMGRTRTARRHKAACVLDAARALAALEPSVVTAEDARATQTERITRAYTSVHGLGWVTAEYFVMLLGAEGVKADRMVRRFVDAALIDAGQPPLRDPRDVHDLVVAAHAVDGRGVGLTAYEHAIWRTKGTLAQRG